MLSLAHALSVAIEAAKAAGDIIRDAHGKVHSIETKSSPRDLVTQVDHAAQEAIVRTIQEEFPDHRFFAEEVGAEDLGDPDSPYLWIVDPLDGTKNFVHGKKSCGTMIALQENGETVVAVTYNPFTRDLATAIRGQGTFLNGKPAILRKTRDLTDAILATNTMREACIEDGVCRPVFPVCGDIHNYGAAIEEFAAILRGENDGIFFFNTNPWDVVPGFLLVEEAGGSARMESNDPANPRGGVRGVASTKPIFDELCRFVWNEERETSNV